MSGRTPSERSDDQDERPTKQRRTQRACLQCRVRKQRCLTLPQADARAKCRRCNKLEIDCSFQNDPILVQPGDLGPTKMAQLIADLQKSVAAHEDRLAILESSLHNSPDVNDALVPISRVETDAIVDPPIQTNLDPVLQSIPALDGVDVNPPLAALRSLGAWPSHPLASTGNWSARGMYPVWDPILQNILTEAEAKQAFEIFFDHCHPHGPVLDVTSRANDQQIRQSSPVLFLAICTIGCRYWPGPHGIRLFPKYTSLTALLDIALSRLLLSPSPADLNIDSIRALLLYAQWMPLSSTSPEDLPKTRYNDISAWAVLGLAIRYATSLKLERLAVGAFAREEIDQVDMSRLRVWHNLLTCDANLMLSSGLPTSLDPTSAAGVAATFSSHRLSQYPEDLRVTGLVELVVIIHSATRSGWHIGILDRTIVDRLNQELDRWETRWTERLSHLSGYHCTLPFSSSRWYRLVLNSTSLSTMVQNRSDSEDSRSFLSRCLAHALTAAAQTILALSTNGPNAWQLSSQVSHTFPKQQRFQPDPTALDKMLYTVDSAWISLTFAITFMVLCYARGVIDDSLQIQRFETRRDKATIRSRSMLSRLLHLVIDTFDGICSSVSIHPAHDYRAIVRMALKTVTMEDEMASVDPHMSPITRPGGGSHTISGEYVQSPGLFAWDTITGDPKSAGDVNIGADLQGLLEIMAVNGMEWSANLMSTDNATRNT